MVKGFAESWRQSVREIGPYLDLGMRFLISILIGLFGGYYLDKGLRTTPLFLLVGVVVGSVAGFLMIYRSVYRK